MPPGIFPLSHILRIVIDKPELNFRFLPQQSSLLGINSLNFLLSYFAIFGRLQGIDMNCIEFVFYEGI